MGGAEYSAGSDMHKEPPRTCELVSCFGIRKTKQKSLNPVRLQRVHIRSFGYNPSQFVSTVNSVFPDPSQFLQDPFSKLPGLRIQETEY